MSWYQILTLDLAAIALVYPCVNWWVKRGYVKVPELCQDGKVALTAGVNQIVLLDLSSGEFSNVVIAA